MASPDDILKQDLFQRLGFGGDAARLEEALQEAGLSRPGKPRISLAKEPQVREVLEARFVRVCQRAECRELAGERSRGKEAVPAAKSGDCEMCGGSINAMAVSEMVRACRRAGWRRLCVVGGSPNTVVELLALVGEGIELRVVEGTVARTKRDAEGDVAWADRVIIWGSTELAHKVSALYKGPNVINVARRSVSELAKAVTVSAGRSKK